MPKELSTKEGLAFQYWFIVLRLLDIGFPYDKIENFTEQEVAMILGTQMALEQRQADLQAQQMSH